MKKVLIMSYFFPPHQAIGSQRPYRLAKYFPECGWEPIILTVKQPGKRPEGIRVIETDYYNDILNKIKLMIGFNSKKTAYEQSGIKVSNNSNCSAWKRKIIKLTKEVINFPDDKRGWYKLALKSASEILLKEKLDVIISTSPSVITHLVARRLSRKFRIPWVADLRDPWAQLYVDRKCGLIKYFERRLASKTLDDADVLVTVTNPQADVFKTLFKDKKIFCITNGYDTDDFPETSSELTDKFTITHTGQLYNGERDPSLLFEVVGNLVKNNRIKKDLIEIRFYGPEEDWLIEDVKKYNLEGVVNFYGVVSREEALERQRESQLLLLLRLNYKTEKGDCPGKLFEYFGARRPIIAAGGYGGIIEDFFEETNAGKCGEKAEVLENILLEYYEEFVRSGKVRCCSNNNIENYTYDSIARKYSEILDYCSKLNSLLPEKLKGGNG